VKQQVTTMTTTTKSSEYFLRLESARLWKERIHQAQRTAWKDSIATSPILAALDSLTRIRRRDDETQPAEEKIPTATTTTTTRPCKRARVVIEKEEEEDYQLYSSLVGEAAEESSSASGDDAIFPFELLPCLMIYPPSPCRLDRAALTEALFASISTTTTTTSMPKQPKNTRVMAKAVVWIPRLLSSLQATLSLVLRQCLQQEPSAALRQSTRKLFQKKKRVASGQESILWWASQTQHYDQVVILLEVNTNE
jgi:hypothetical protein